MGGDFIIHFRAKMDDDRETLEAISTLQSLLDSTTLALAHGMEPFFPVDYEILEDIEGGENPNEWIAEIESILQRDNTEILQHIVTMLVRASHKNMTFVA